MFHVSKQKKIIFATNVYVNSIKYCSLCQTDNLRYERNQMQQLVCVIVYYIYHISANF